MNPEFAKQILIISLTQDCLKSTNCEMGVLSPFTRSNTRGTQRVLFVLDDYNEGTRRPLRKCEAFLGPGFCHRPKLRRRGAQAARADVQKRVPLRALLGFDAQVKLQCLISHFY